MPELPEVETVRRGLERTLPRRRLRSVTLRREDLRWPIPVAAVRDLAGRQLRSVQRRSKYLLLQFAGVDAPVAMIHLGMSGRLFVDVVGRRRGEPPWTKHEHWRMDFGTRLLRFEDARRFGSLDVVPSQALGGHPLLHHLGPEPLEPGFDGGRVFAHTRHRRTAIKTWLMDARNVVGVGNIYASEACFRAGVRPRRRADRVTRAECERLAAAVRTVLAEAIAQGGTTLRDYIGVDSNAGYFQQSLAVYGREGEPCTRCGETVKRVVMTGRSTYYCPRCQR